MEQRQFLSDGTDGLTLAERLRRTLANARVDLIPQLHVHPRVPPDLIHAPAAVLMAVTDRPEPGLILTRRASHLRKHAGQVAFPGGRVDDGDADPAATALREAWEEIALPPDQVEIIGRTSTFKTATGFEILPVLAVVPPDLDLRPHEAEVESVFELPLHFAVNGDNWTRKLMEWGGEHHPYFEAIWADYRIWGITANIIANLSQWLGYDRTTA